MIQSEFIYAAISIDNVIFGFDDKELKILLIKRAADPFINHWALPGAIVGKNENLEDAPKRVLEESTGLTNVFLDQVQTFGSVKRHPLGRVITVAYYSLVNIKHVKPKPAAYANEVQWQSVNDLLDLAFDHKEIILSCLGKLRRMVQVRPIGFELLPVHFSLSQLQSLYEAVLDKQLDKRNFRKKLLKMNILSDLNRFQEGVPHRPAKLYSFDSANYQKLAEDGLSFEI